MSKTPPGTEADKPKATKPKTEKAEKPKSDKPRAPRKDYGFLPGAVITITEQMDTKTYRGKRKEYADRLAACNGKTVETFFGVCPEGDPPRGWLRFFVSDGVATLSGGKAPEPKPAKEKEAPEAAAA